MLCEVCEQLLQDDGDQIDSVGRTSQNHHLSLESFYASIEKCCQICTALCDSPVVQRRLGSRPTGQSPVFVVQKGASNITKESSLHFFILSFFVGKDRQEINPPVDSDLTFTVVPTECWSSSNHRSLILY